MWFVLVQFALYDTVHRKKGVRKCCQRLHTAMFKVGEANFILISRCNLIENQKFSIISREE
jgi:hypothetical protein